MDRHNVSLGLLFLRLFGGGIFLYGRSAAWTALIAAGHVALANPLGFSGEVSWVLTLFSECLCTILVILGVFTRFTAVPPLVVMLVMALAMPGGTAWSVRETYLLYALPFFVLTFTGAGDYSVDGRVSAWANPR